MIELFQMGGPLFMGILSIIFIGVIITTVYYLKSSDKNETSLNRIKSLGQFAMVFGILGQLIGLYDAFKFIEQAGSISPGMLAGGFKVSMITTLYGIIIYVISYLIWLALQARK